MPPPVPQELVVQQPVKPLAIMAIAATNNAERMVHFLVSKIPGRLGSYENRVCFLFLLTNQRYRMMKFEPSGLRKNLRERPKEGGQIVEDARTPRTVNSLIVPAIRNIEQNRRERRIGATGIRLLGKL